MSDSSLFNNKVTLSGSFKAFLLYATADVVMSLVQSLSGMTSEDWGKMSAHQQIAFWLAPVGSLALAAKMFYSGSAPAAKAANPNPTPNP
jgi:heme/copper-type cytochrome/quinol oxidase subunit 1